MVNAATITASAVMTAIATNMKRAPADQTIPVAGGAMLEPAGIEAGGLEAVDVGDVIMTPT